MTTHCRPRPPTWGFFHGSRMLDRWCPLIGWLGRTSVIDWIRWQGWRFCSGDSCWDLRRRFNDSAVRQGASSGTEVLRTTFSKRVHHSRHSFSLFLSLSLRLFSPAHCLLPSASGCSTRSSNIEGRSGESHTSDDLKILLAYGAAKRVYPLYQTPFFAEALSLRRRAIQKGFYLNSIEYNSSYPSIDLKLRQFEYSETKVPVW
jgi:hypothetical protein